MKKNNIELDGLSFNELYNLFKEEKLSLQEFYNEVNTETLAKEWGMSAPTLIKKLKERGIKNKGKGKRKTKELPI